MASSSSSDSRSYRAARNARAALSRASRRAVMAAAVALGATFLMDTNAHAAPAVGQKAPDFVAVDTSGKQHRLSRLRGQVRGARMDQPGLPLRAQALRQRQHARHAEGGDRQGRGLAGGQLDRARRQRLPAAGRARCLDEGAVGRADGGADGRGRRDRPAYGARTTPHIYIIDPKGVLVYAGGIDSIPSSRVDDIKTATNYVNQALGEAFGGKPISAAATRPYGCSIKYKA